MIQTIFRSISHLVFRIREYNDKCLKRFAKKTHHKKILEIGSGKPVNGKYEYSAAHYFDSTNTFVQSDINKSFGHKVVDVTKMKIKDEYDAIICNCVLEHVYDIHSSVKNIHRALKKGGIASILVPAAYPLHDEPHDYWRFTEYSLKKLLADFSSISIDHSGLRKLPVAYYVEAKK